MDSERWHRMETLFCDARALPASAREAFLERECGEDAELCAEVHRLLSASEEVGDRFERLVERAGAEFGGDDVQGQEPAPPGPERIGPFRICGLLGQGGLPVGTTADGRLAFGSQLGSTVALAGEWDSSAETAANHQHRCDSSGEHGDPAPS